MGNEKSETSTASPLQKIVSKQETARLMSGLLNSSNFFKLMPEEERQFEMARLAEQAPIPNFTIGIAC